MSKQEFQKFLAILYCILNTIIFCLHLFAAKIILKEVPALAFASARGLWGGAILIAIFYKAIPGNLNWKSIKNVTIVAFLGFFINQIFFMYGLRLSTPTNAAIIINTIPIATTLMAILFYLESFTWKKMSGIALGFGLVIYMSLSGEDAKLTANFLGDFLILLQVLSFCLAMTIGKKIMNENFPHVLLSAGMLFIGGIFLYACSAHHTMAVIRYTFASQWNFWLMFFEVVISTSLTYLLTFKSLQILAPSQTMIFIYFQPPIAVMLAYMFYGKTPSIILLPIFLGITLSGYLVLAKSKEKKKVKEDEVKRVVL